MCYSCRHLPNNINKAPFSLTLYGATVANQNDARSKITSFPFMFDYCICCAIMTNKAILFVSLPFHRSHKFTKRRAQVFISDALPSPSSSPTREATPSTQIRCPQRRRTPGHRHRIFIFPDKNENPEGPALTSTRFNHFPDLHHGSHS